MVPFRQIFSSLHPKSTPILRLLPGLSEDYIPHLVATADTEEHGGFLLQ